MCEKSLLLSVGLTSQANSVLFNLIVCVGTDAHTFMCIKIYDSEYVSFKWTKKSQETR